MNIFGHLKVLRMRKERRGFGWKEGCSGALRWLWKLAIEPLKVLSHRAMFIHPRTLVFLFLLPLLFGQAAYGDINLDLLEAAEAGDTAKVEKLIEQGADVNRGKFHTKYRDGMTALMCAASKGHTETVKALIDAGANVNAKDKLGYTALMDAAYRGHAETAKALIDAGANVNAETETGQTALMRAEAKGHTKIVDTLKKAGAASGQRQPIDGYASIKFGMTKAQVKALKDKEFSEGVLGETKVLEFSENFVGREVKGIVIFGGVNALPPAILLVTKISNEVQRAVWCDKVTKFITAKYGHLQSRDIDTENFEEYGVWGDEKNGPVIVLFCSANQITVSFSGTKKKSK